MKKKEKLVKNTIIILIGKICTQMISFFLLPLYTSYLVSEEYGIVDLIITYVALLVPVISLQLENAIFRFLIDARNDKEQIEKLISTDIFCLLRFITIAVILCIFLNFFTKIEYVYYIIGIIIANMIASNFMQISRGLGNNIDYSIASILVGATTVILNVVFIVLLKYGAKGMLLAMLIANILGSIYLFYKTKIHKYIKYNRFDKKIQRNMLKYSIPLIPNGVSWWIMNASDRTIISWILGISANGIYAVSNKFPSLLTSFFNVFNISWSESASLNINDEDKDEYISSVCNDVLRLFGCVGALLLTGIPLIFDLLINESYNEAYLYVPILILSSIFSLMASQYGSIYIAKKDTKKIAITTLISAFINIIVHIALIKIINLYAAAISTAISYFVIMIYRHFDIRKYVNIKYSNNIVQKMCLIYAISFIVYYLKNNILSIILLICICIFSIWTNYKLIYAIKEKIVEKIRGKVVIKFRH